jgi:hypothetical protein
MLLGVLMATNTLAEGVNIALIMDKLTPYQLSEGGGDEVYLDFLIYPPKGRGQHFLMPHKPLHWPSFMLKKLNHVVLWQGKLLPGDKTKMLASLLEKDFPPWNRDDLIGSFSLILENKKGQLVYALNACKTTKPSFLPMTVPLKPLMLAGNGMRYELKLSLEKVKPMKPKIKKASQ